MSPMRSAYDILGVKRSASFDEIKSSYKRLIRELHPDNNKGDHAVVTRFREVREAYESVKDPKSRDKHDRHNTGAAWFDGESLNRTFRDVFNDIFGSKEAEKQRGKDISVNLTVTIDEAYNLKKRDISYTQTSDCSVCVGTGFALSDEGPKCKTCHGFGKIRSVSDPNGMSSCPICFGTGHQPSVCDSCNGEKTEVRTKALTVSLPAGLTNNHKIRLRGMGGVSVDGGQNGDLYIFVSLVDDEAFRLRGGNLHIRSEIDCFKAILGGDHTLRMPGGKEFTTTILAGTQPNTVMTISGIGMPRPDGSRGPAIIEMSVRIPTDLDEETKKMISQLSV